MKIIYLLLLLNGINYSCSLGKQCIDENGNPVDWFVVYKLPRIKDHPNVNVQQGIAYVYTTSETVKTGWILGNETIDNISSILGKTLSVIISDDPQEIFSIFYNDQPPDEPFTIKEGHTKGVIVGDENGGFWLVHSIPKFPVINKEQGYVYPKTGYRYGQSALCLTLGKATLEDVAKQLMINQANVFKNDFGNKMELIYPELKKAAQMGRLSQKKNKELIVTEANQHFVSFAKSDSFGEDLYSNWVNDVLKCELYVETWLHEAKLPSDCNDTYQVHNIEKLSINSTSVEWINMADHAKWTVSAQKCRPWVCVGDINRASTQFIRGGGTVCIENPDLWDVYFSIVTEVESCPQIPGN